MKQSPIDDPLAWSIAADVFNPLFSEGHLQIHFVIAGRGHGFLQLISRSKLHITTTPSPSTIFVLKSKISTIARDFNELRVQLIAITAKGIQANIVVHINVDADKHGLVSNDNSG